MLKHLITLSLLLYALLVDYVFSAGDGVSISLAISCFSESSIDYYHSTTVSFLENNMYRLIWISTASGRGVLLWASSMPMHFKALIEG